MSMVTHEMPLKPKTIGFGVLLTIFLYVSGLLVIFTPLPLVYVFATTGRRNGALAAFVSLAIVVFLYMAALWSASGKTFVSVIPLPGLGLVPHFPLGAIEMLGSGYFVFFLVIAVALGEAVRRHWGVVKGGVSAVAAGLILSVIIALILELTGMARLVGATKGYLEFVVGEVVRLEEAAGVSSVQLTLLQEHGTEVASFVFHIIPSIVFVFALTAVVFNMLLSRKVIRLPHVFSGHVWDLAAFRISDVFVWGVIGSAAAFFASQYLDNLKWLQYVGVNLLISLLAVYFFQGLAVAAFFIRRIHIPLLKILTYVFIVVFFQMAFFLIIGLGLADIWVDFRHRTKMISQPPIAP